MAEKVVVVTPWHDPDQRDAFLHAWNLEPDDPRLVLQQDVDRSGCAVTKNTGIARAIALGADVVVVLDDDCFPHEGYARSIDEFIEEHLRALKPTEVRMFEAVTSPPSRGTPYADSHHLMEMPVAASMGFWTCVGDHCAARQLVHGPTPMKELKRAPIFGRYFPLSGMNLAFRPADWLPWCQFIDVPRFDDIWMGWLWQREAHRRGYCFNLAGPIVRHSRQSNVWANLKAEAEHLEANETLWRRIAGAEFDDYESLRALLPVP